MELSYFAIIIGAIFVNNVVLAQFLGICPFLGVSSKVETSMGMGAAVTFVMAIAAVVAWLIQTYVLVPLDIVYMQTIVFILVIAALVQMVEIMLKKLSPSLYQALGIFLPLITTNCAVLGVAKVTPQLCTRKREVASATSLSYFACRLSACSAGGTNRWRIASLAVREM